VDNEATDIYFHHLSLEYISIVNFHASPFKSIYSTSLDKGGHVIDTCRTRLVRLSCFIWYCLVVE